MLCAVLCVAPGGGCKTCYSGWCKCNEEIRAFSRQCSVGVGLGIFTYLVIGKVVDLLVGVGMGVFSV